MQERFWGAYVGRVVDRWHKSRPGKDEPECGEHKGKVASKAHGQGRRWQARYDGPDGKERTGLFRTQAEAERHIVTQESAKLTGSWIDPARGRMTVRKLVYDIWLPSTATQSQTRREYRGVMERYLIPEWGTREARSIRPSEAGAWQQLLTDKYELSGSTPNRVARYVRGVFRIAVLDRIIAVSPFTGIKAPTLEYKQVRPPNPAEVLRLIEHAYNDRWRTMTELTALTGLRSGEVRGLRVDRINFLRQELLVDSQLVYEPDTGLRFSKLKTSTGLRTLPLPPEAVDLLAAYVAKYPPQKDGPWAGLIFTMPGGEPIGESTLDWALKQTCRYAGAPARHWHELRHHYASVLIAGGENPKVVQKRLGHKDVLTTLRIYSHLFDEAEEKTRDVLSEAWRKAREEFSGKGGRIPESGPGIARVSQLRP